MLSNGPIFVKKSLFIFEIFAIEDDSFHLELRKFQTSLDFFENDETALNLQRLHKFPKNVFIIA